MSIATAVAAGPSNILAYTEPGVGTINEATTALKAAGRDVIEIAVKNYNAFDFTTVVPGGAVYPAAFLLEVDTLILSHVEDMTPEVANLVSEIITDRSVAGIKLPNIKNVVLVAYGRPGKIDELIAAGHVIEIEA